MFKDQVVLSSYFCSGAGRHCKRSNHQRLDDRRRRRLAAIRRVTAEATLVQAESAERICKPQTTNNSLLMRALPRRVRGLQNSLVSYSEPARLILRVSSRLTAMTDGILRLGRGSIRTTGKTPQSAELTATRGTYLSHFRVVLDLRRFQFRITPQTEAISVGAGNK